MRGMCACLRKRACFWDTPFHAVAARKMLTTLNPNGTTTSGGLRADAASTALKPTEVEDARHPTKIHATTNRSSSDRDCVETKRRSAVKNMWLRR